MGNRRISDDLKEAALRLKARGDSDSEITRITGFSRRTLYRIQLRKRQTGSVTKALAIGRGRRRSLAQADANYLLGLARHKPTMFLDEYRQRLEKYRILRISMATIHRTFQRARLSVKRVQKLALERDPIKRADFIRRIGQYPADYLINLDEMSKDDRTYSRLWGRSPIGARVEVLQPFVRKRRFSLLAALTVSDGIPAAQVLEGSFTRKTFYEFLRDCVVSLPPICILGRTQSATSFLSAARTQVQIVYSSWIMPAFIMGQTLRSWSMATVCLFTHRLLLIL